MNEFQVRRPTRLVSLQGPNVGQVCQDVWLTKCDSDGYRLTRLWGVAIRGWAPLEAGFIWWARRDEHELALVLYDDRVSAVEIEPIAAPVPLDRGPGLNMVVSIPARHNVTVA
jgi:hypothetical protein